MGIEVAHVHDGSADDRWEVRIPIENCDVAEFAKALSLVQTYQDLSKKATGVRIGERGNSDWAMFAYTIHNNHVLVEVSAGARE